MRFDYLDAGWAYYPRSIIEYNSTTYFLVRNKTRGEKSLVVLGDTASFQGVPEIVDRAWLFPLTAANAATLRGRLPWLEPLSLELWTSAGFGDRLGIATPGHVQAALRFPDIAPVFAQQSVRENARTGRSPQEVLDQAMWGVFEIGWQHRVHDREIR